MYSNSESTSITSKILVNMARVLIALCCAFSLYSILVSLATGQVASPVSIPESPLIEAEKLKYESNEANTVIDAILDSKDDQTRKRPKSKLNRLLAARRSSDEHLSRYSVVENDLNRDVEESYSDCGYHLAFTLIEQSSNEHQYASKLMTKFSNTLSSILFNINSTNLDPGSLCIHLITDDSIRPHIQQTISKVHEDLLFKSNQHNHNHHIRHFNRERGDDDDDDDEYQDSDQHRPITRYFFIDSATVEARLDYLLPTLRSYFTHRPNSYYSNALFFYSMVLHHVIPKTVADRLILIDVDIQLTANILELFEEFGRFKQDEVIGIAYEQQPVYRHILHEYRRDHPDTTIGSPSPAGFPGFNSGVLLLHLRKMRDSKQYNSLLDSTVIGHLCRKYRFRGHLGDQDFYTVAAIDYRSLFHTLPCGWNRQLCQWWRFHGYGQVFDQYHSCEDQVKLYHGNCNSALPSLPSYGNYRRR